MSNFTTSLTQFTNKQNIKLLWDVLLDEFKINTSNKTLVNNIKTVFESNISPFTLRANNQLNVMELNKQFLSQVVLAVNRLFPNLSNLQKQEQNIKRITISDEEVSEPYKVEDIHASRQSEFEKEVDKKRMELENYMIPQKPKELDFSDNNSDGKIKAMDSLVADKMSQRNIEFEMFEHNNYNSSIEIDPEKWLTATETSVNNKTLTENKSIIKNNQNTKLKHMSIDSNNNITLKIDEIEKNTKKVAWNDLSDKSSTINIFNKLKKHPENNNVNDDNDNNDNNKQYVQQKSISLPQVKQEEISRNQITFSTSNNEPVIPKIEIIKQLNEMNRKIDNLYEMIFKLTTIIEKNNIDVLKINNEIE
jgi:hypothetical protein